VFAAILLPMGVAMMATMVTSTLAATSEMDRLKQGLAAGVRQTSFQLGIALGVAILLSIRRHPHGSIGAGVPPIGHAQALASGYQFAMFLLAALVVLASPVSFIGLRPRAPSRDESTASA
jgi:hypothetical protein